MCGVDKDKKVRDLFNVFFGNKNIYGRDVYIFGVDMIPDGLENLIKEKFEIEKGEELLLAFDSKHGFVLTTEKFYWKDISNGNNIWNLQDIYDVNREKRGLANVIYFIGRKNNVSEDVYLTGIDNVYEFVFAFADFFRRLSGKENKNINLADKIAEACLSAPLEMAAACVYGNPINNNNSKLNTVRTYFGIPGDEKIFIILDSSMFGNGKEGFAIGTDGIYYCLSKKQGKISWNEFADKTIKQGFSSVKIGELDFTCNMGFEKNGLYAILRNIKSVVSFIDVKGVQIQDKNENYIEDNDDNIKSEKIKNENSQRNVRFIAEKYFSDGVFGEKVYLFKKNYDKDAVKYITRNYSLDTTEDPLLIFNYKENYDQGFLLTTHRFIWKYRGLSGDWNIQDIGAVDHVKYMSYIDSMMLFDKNFSKYSSNIVLTYIPDPALFIYRFALFLSELVPAFCGNSRLATILKYVACSNSKVSACGITWKKLNPPKYYKEQDDKQKAYLMDKAKRIRESLFIDEDETLYGANETNNKGSNAYAFTEYGVYYKNSNDAGRLSWEEFKNLTIKILDNHNISIGNITLEVDGSIKDYYKLLSNLQDAVKWNWDEVFGIVKTEPKINNNKKFILDSIPQQIANKYASDIAGITFDIDPIKFDGGRSVRIDKQVVAFKEAININAEKNVFLIVPAGTVSNYGKKSKGFAIAEDGFYYRNDLGQVGVISWEKYLEQKIYLDIFVYVGENGFNVSGALKRHVVNLLNALQEYISEYINGTEQHNISTKDSNDIKSTYGKSITDKDALASKEISIKENALKVSEKEVEAEKKSENVEIKYSGEANKADTNKVNGATNESAAVEPIKIQRKEQEEKKQKQIEQKNIEFKDTKKIIEETTNQKEKQPDQKSISQEENDRIRREEILMELAEKIERKNTLGVVSLILSIIGLVTTFIIVGIVPDIIALILSVKALSKKGKNKKAAVAGLIISLVGTAIWIIEVLAFGL